MTRWIAVVILGAVAGCAAPKTTVEYGATADLARYHRIAVLPFADRKGRGQLIAKAIAKGLPARGFEAADAERVQAVFSKFRPDADRGLGITELNEIRQATKAQALLSGAVDPTGRQAAVILLETDQGDEIFKATLYPEKGKTFAGVDDVAEQALGLFAEISTRQQ